MLVILGGGFFISIQSYFSYGTASQRNLLTSILLKARNEAVNNVCFGGTCTTGVPHGVKIIYDSATHEIQKYVLFQGAQYNPTDPFNQDIGVNYQLFYLTTNSNPVSEIAFDQLTGKVNLGGNSTGSIEISDNAKHLYTITINSEGGISW